MEDSAASPGDLAFAPRRLPVPPDLDAGVDAAVAWVVEHLGDLAGSAPRDAPLASGRFRGGQRSADAALAALDLAGYAESRNEVLPSSSRGATGLSPYVRHGLLDLPTLWRAAAEAPPRDRDRFRDELLWQEYARHLYARLGRRTGDPLRHEDMAAHRPTTDADDPWLRARASGMACVSDTLDELTRDGWIVNLARMWMASLWCVRVRSDWGTGEERLYRELIDGSRAANRLGWQWTVGAATGRPYGFSRSQVERRAPGLCTSCALVDSCPIADWPVDPPFGAVEPEPLLRGDPDPARTAGPTAVERRADGARADAVWITAESLGDADPALAAHPDVPAVFVFDAALLARLRLHPRRLVFLAETLGDLATRRQVEVWRGDVAATLGAGVGVQRPLAATFTPVPGWRTRADRLPVVERWPWPWLRRPQGGSLTSFSAWRGRSRR
jgi:deoxyribodipyrimidine photo-lyase